ncbi:MAG: YihY/virulence factor BrkB family protein [Pseudomonadota bacterium]
MDNDSAAPGPATWWSIAKAVYAQIDEQNMSLISAGVAFFGMLAMFPGIAALIAIFGLLADPMIIQEQIVLLEGILPAQVLELVNAQMGRLLSAGTQTLGWATALSIFLALWSARAGVGAIMRGLNTIYRSPNRSAISHYFAAFSLTVTLVGVAVIAGAAIVVTPVVLAFLPLSAQAAAIIDLIRWSAAIFVITMGIMLIYRYGPRKREGRRTPWLTPGAAFATVMWAAASVGFSQYLANFGRYNEVYGSIGAVVALLMWLYLSAFLVLLGGALNAQLERSKRL